MVKLGPTQDPIAKGIIMRLQSTGEYTAQPSI